MWLGKYSWRLEDNSDLDYRKMTWDYQRTLIKSLLRSKQKRETSVWEERDNDF